MSKHRVCIVVDNDVYKDNRVKKYWKTLARKYDVVTVGFSRERILTARTNGDFILAGSLLVFVYEKAKSLLKRVRPSSEIMTAVHRTSGRASVRFLLRDLVWYLVNSAVRNKLLKVISKVEADVFHANDLPVIVPVVNASRKTGSKVIYDSHELYLEQGMFVSDFVLNRYRSEEEKSIRQSDAVITVNEFIARELAKRYRMKREPHVIYNYPYATRLKAGTRRTGDEIVLLYQGLYTPGRGLEEIIEAMKYVDKRFRLKLRGVGNYAFELKNLVKKNRLEDRVEFLSAVDSSKLTGSAEFADVGIVMYKPDCLNSCLASPNKLFEYINAGLAVLCNDLPFVKSIVTKYELGACVTQITPKALASTINRLDRQSIEKFRANARNVSNIFTWENQEPKIFEIYDKVLSGR